MEEIQLYSFDLDGTLLDTAPDFFYAVNKLRKDNGLESGDFLEVRSRVSQGAASLAAYALNLENKSPQKIEFHRQELLEIYESCCLLSTVIFDGVEYVLNQLNNQKIKWGIVTNKPRKFAEGIVEDKLGAFKPPFLICPDDVGARKPDPDGLLLALEVSNSKPSKSIYIGDHIIDIQAGEKARMITGAAAYGYIPINDNVMNWNSNHVFNEAKDIISLIAK